MLICSAAQCAVCLFPEGSAACLRRQAERCTRLSKRVLSRGLHEALAEHGMELMDRARVIEHEQAVALAPAGGK